MATSFISHRSADGGRLHAVLSLGVLQSIDGEQREALEKLGIRSLADLLHWAPAHRAQIVLAIAQNNVAHDVDLRMLVNDAHAHKSAEELVKSEVKVIEGLGDPYSELLREHFAIETVSQLAGFAPFVEAQRILRDQSEPFSEPASAPDELIPRAIGAEVSKVRYNSFVKERDLELGGVTMDSTSNSVDARLKDVFTGQEPPLIGLGYMVLHLQTWTSLGTQLGEVIHSLALAPGQSKNVAVVDWKSSLVARRAEATDFREQLNSLLVHTRALDEVTRATAEEHQAGRTSTAAATGVTAGGAVAAGSMIGAIGGAVVGGATGLGVDALTGGLDLGAGTITGTVTGAFAGSAVGSFAGGAAASLIFSGAAALGHVESDTEGDRKVTAYLQQNIQDTVSQKASALRSLRSTIVVEDTQTEGEAVTTYNVTNYNHAHALTIQYFAVLDRFNVAMAPQDVAPIFFLPFRPLDFDNLLIISDYWHILRTAIQRKRLVKRIDQLLEETGIISMPDQPLSQSPEARLTRLKVKLRSGVNITVATKELSVIADGIAHALPFVDTYAELEGLETLWSDVYQGSWDADGPFLKDVEGIRFKYGGVVSPFGVNYTCIVTEFVTNLESAGSDQDQTLGDFSIPASAGAGGSKTLAFDLPAVVQDAEQTQSSQFSLLKELTRYLKRRAYYFSRLVLGSLEPNQLRDLIMGLRLSKYGYKASLHQLIDPVPIGFTSGAIVFRMKKKHDLDDGPLIEQLGAELRESGVELDQGQLEQLASWIRRQYAPTDIGFYEILNHAKDVREWFEKNKGQLRTVDEIHLPTSGVFAEAILGRSNAAEKIDLTRFINWQDSPIPNAAPRIADVTLGDRGKPTPDMNVTQTEGVLNIQPPTTLPDPTGMAAVLGAIQNGSMFRDMSKSAVLGSVLGQLAGVAERTAIAAGNLSGEALRETLQSATALGQTVAQGVQGMAGDAFGSMTELGGKLAELEKMKQGSDIDDDKKTLIGVNEPDNTDETQESSATDKTYGETRAYDFLFITEGFGNMPLEGYYTAILTYNHDNMTLLNRVSSIDADGWEIPVAQNSVSLQFSKNDALMSVHIEPFKEEPLSLRGKRFFQLPTGKSTVTIKAKLKYKETIVKEANQEEAKKLEAKKLAEKMASKSGMVGRQSGGVGLDYEAVNANVKAALEGSIEILDESEISATQETVEGQTESQTKTFKVRRPTEGLDLVIE